jgi:hypothetical protein
LVPNATARVAYIAFEYGVGPGPSGLAVGVAEVLFGRFEGPSSVTCSGRNLRLRSSPHVIKILWKKGVQMCSGRGLDAALLGCLAPQLRSVESIQFFSSSHICKLAESERSSDRRAASIVVNVELRVLQGCSLRLIDYTNMRSLLIANA